MALKLNEKAPDFTLPSTEGTPFTLSKDAAEEGIIIYFYPKDFTRVCTKEACSFRDNFDFFKDLKIKVVGISTDSLEVHQKFKKQHQLPFDLLADVNGKVSKLYKAYIPFVHLSKRVTYLLDRRHRIAAVYSELFGAEGHIKEMIEKIR